MEVLINNRQNKHKIPQKRIKQTARAILDALDCPNGELSILLIDDQQIEKINIEYLNREGPTNVIAFPMREGEFSDLTPDLLGDVVISVETACREADSAGISMQKRFDQLLIHGILHLIGYDHEKTQKEARRMEEKSSDLLKMLDLAVDDVDME